MTPGIPRELLQRIGVARYWHYWVAPMAIRLNVGERKMRRWANGELCMPVDLCPKLIAIMREHRDTIDALITELERLK